MEFVHPGTYCVYPGKTDIRKQRVTGMRIVVIGGGAAGFFAAIKAAESHQGDEVLIFEQSSQVLSKVKVSGGGRCNVTNSESDISRFLHAYPRGERFLRHAIHAFDSRSTCNWFENRGVPLVVEENGHIFPKSGQSLSIIQCLTHACTELGVGIRLRCPVRSMMQDKRGFTLQTGQEMIQAEKVIVATGGSPKRSGLQWLIDLGHDIEEPVPSLFTFNIPEDPITGLMGLSVPQCKVRIEGTKFEQRGALLITHWGMSGPAVLKLSSYAARYLAGQEYRFRIRVNWLDEPDQNEVRIQLEKHVTTSGQRLRKNSKAFALPERLWHFLLEKSGLPLDRSWSETGTKGIGRLVENLCNDMYTIQGKTTFKEEFVTCGGISLRDVNPRTMESRKVPGLYFAGEVLDIDAITGGYNFQAAWSTGWQAGQLRSE